MAIAIIPPELVQELEHAGGLPLPVEDPLTKRRYVLVDVEQYDVIRRPRPAAKNMGGWTEHKNERRCALIRKQFSSGLDAAEARELDELQTELSAHRRIAVPLPYDVVDVLEGALNPPATTPS